MLYEVITLEFLPERDTDFIFAVMGEELGLLGVLALLGLYLFIVGRGLYIAIQARDTFSRLLAGSISLTFFVYVFVNTAMVTGLVPVVGSSRMYSVFPVPIFDSSVASLTRWASPPESVVAGWPR